MEANEVSIRNYRAGDELINSNVLQSLTFSRLSDIHIGLRLNLLSFILSAIQSQAANLLQAPLLPLSGLMPLSKAFCTVESNLAKSRQTTSFT